MMLVEKCPEQARTIKRTLSQVPSKKYLLRLFVSGDSRRSIQAIEYVTEICEARLKGRYSLEVVDMYKQPRRAREEDIVASPTLIKSRPLPLRKLVGSMANTTNILHALDLQVA